VADGSKQLEELCVLKNGRTDSTAVGERRFLAGSSKGELNRVPVLLSSAPHRTSSSATSSEIEDGVAYLDHWQSYFALTLFGDLPISNLGWVRLALQRC
jgi:hypothetical protein